MASNLMEHIFLATAGFSIILYSMHLPIRPSLSSCRSLPRRNILPGNRLANGGNMSLLPTGMTASLLKLAVLKELTSPPTAETGFPLRFLQNSILDYMDRRFLDFQSSHITIGILRASRYFKRLLVGKGML